MNKKVTLGGDRIGSGNKNQVELQGFERSTHDLSNAWRTTMSAGTLVPFMVHPSLPGDVWEIQLDADVMTHPTIGPLLGSMKVQLDVFTVPMRLYNSWVHNNKLGIGLNMQNVKMPVYTIGAWQESSDFMKTNPAKYPINNSHILKYLGISGVGLNYRTDQDYITRDFNAIPLLGYWDIFKNYYANKQEQWAYVISTDPSIADTMDKVYGDDGNGNMLDITTTPFTISPSGYWTNLQYQPITQDPSLWNVPLIVEQLFLKDSTLILGNINAIANGNIVYRDNGGSPVYGNIYVFITYNPDYTAWVVNINFTAKITATIDGWIQNAEVS